MGNSEDIELIGYIHRKCFSGIFKPKKSNYTKKAWRKLMELEKEVHPWGAENTHWRTRPDEPESMPKALNKLYNDTLKRIKDANVNQGTGVLSEAL